MAIYEWIKDCHRKMKVKHIYLVFLTIGYGLRVKIMIFGTFKLVYITPRNFYVRII